ncbi:MULTISPECIES: hypothetical protein, partial [Streptomyces]
TARIDLINAIVPSWFDATCLVLPALMLWDFASLRRLHKVTLWGGLVFLILDFGMGPVGRTAPWMWLMHHVVG